MTGPARAGISIYTLDKDRLARFYESVIGMRRIHESVTVTVLESPDIQLVIHPIPPERASGIAMSSPPQCRDSPLRFFFTIPSLAAAGPVAQELGGGVSGERWQGPGFIVCDAYDPEGNVFHLRERSG